MRRVVYLDDNGRKRVAIITPDGVVHAAKRYTADEIAKRACEESTGQVVKVTKFTRYDPEWGQDVLCYERQEIEDAALPEDLLATCTARAAGWLAKAIEGGVTPERVGELSLEFARQMGEMVAKRVVAQNADAFEIAYPSVAKRTASGDFVPPTPDEGDAGPENPEADPNLAGTPRKKKGPSHVDIQPALEHFDAAATIDCGPSKSIKAALLDEGFESEGEQGGIEIWEHRDLRHVVEVSEDGTFVARSGWNKQSVAKGDCAEDVEQWLAEEATL
jgi:hypothetical protein